MTLLLEILQKQSGQGGHFENYEGFCWSFTLVITIFKAINKTNYLLEAGKLCFVQIWFSFE